MPTAVFDRAIAVERRVPKGSTVISDEIVSTRRGFLLGYLERGSVALSDALGSYPSQMETTSYRDQPD